MLHHFLTRAALALCFSAAVLPNFAQSGAITPDMLSHFRKSVPNNPTSKALLNTSGFQAEIFAKNQRQAKV